MEIKTTTNNNMSFEEYWARNKSRLMNTKYTSEMIAKQIWSDCIDVNGVGK